MADVNSFIADNDTGLVTLLGGSGSGGGGSNLSDLNDVESEHVSHKALLYCDDLSNNFKFSSDISVPPGFFKTLADREKRRLRPKRNKFSK